MSSVFYLCIFTAQSHIKGQGFSMLPTISALYDRNGCQFISNLYPVALKKAVQKIYFCFILFTDYQKASFSAIHKAKIIDSTQNNPFHSLFKIDSPFPFCCKQSSICLSTGIFFCHIMDDGKAHFLHDIPSCMLGQKPLQQESIFHNVRQIKQDIYF